MSQFVIYVNLEKYLAEWATKHLGDPIVFPAQSSENAVIRAYIQKLPPGHLPELKSGNETAIAIPDSKAKPAAVYNHMGRRGKLAVKEALKDLFKRALWADLSPLENSRVGLNSRINAWCEANGIDETSADTVRQCYLRIRTAYNEKGIKLRNNSRKS